MRQRNAPGTIGNISVSQLKTGRWQADAWIYDHQRQRHRIRASAADPTEAVAELNRRANERLRNGHAQITADMTLADATHTWLQMVQSRTERYSRRTVKLYQTWAATIIDTSGDLLLRELTVGACDAIIERITVEQSLAAARNIKKTLSLILGTAARHGALTHNPVRETEQLPGSPRIESALTETGFEAVLQLIRQWRIDQRGGTQPNRDLLYDAVILTLGTSCRPSELLAYRRCDLTDTRNPANGKRVVTVDLCGKIVDAPGEGPVREPYPKHRRQSRIITLPEFAHHAIDRRLHHIGSDPEALLFATSTGRPRSESNLQRLLRTFRNDNREYIETTLKIPPNEFTWKLFRRTAATIVGEDGGLSLASSLLGHATESTTERHYRVRRPEVNPQTATILNARFGGQAATPTPPTTPPDNVIPFRPRRIAQ